MSHILGKTLVVTTLSLISAIIIVSSFEDESIYTQSLINSTDLSKSGIKDLNIEYSNGKIFLNVELTAPTPCSQVIDLLNIRPIEVKRRTYYPTCSQITDTLVKIIYIQILTS